MLHIIHASDATQRLKSREREREGERERGCFRSCALNERKDTEANSAFWFEYFRFLTQTTVRKENTKGEQEKIYKEPWLMRLCRSIHFTAVTV